MSHKTLVNGTVHEVKGGKCLVNGTVYSIKKGRTLINGTGYDITFAPPLMPSKGDLITMNLDGTTRLYRVLSVNGNVCKVMGMWDDFTSVYNSTSTTTTFGSTTAQKYADMSSGVPMRIILIYLSIIISKKPKSFDMIVI